MVIHVGDHAYNFETTGGAVGNNYMKAIEPIAARVPYMASPGNHEVREGCIETAGSYLSCPVCVTAMTLRAIHHGSPHLLFSALFL